MRLVLFSLTLSLTFAGVAPADPPTYLAVGEVAAAGNSELRILSADGTSSTGYAVGGFGPTTSLWDPQHPDQLILGRGSSSTTGGSLSRVTFFAPASETASTLASTGSFGIPVQLSWDQTGTGIIVATVADQLHRVDATTGMVTDLTSGAQPWGTSVNAGAMDRVTGDIYVGTSSGEIWRFVSGATGATLYLSGLGSIQKLIIGTDPSQRYIYVATSNDFQRIALGGPPQPEAFFGIFGTPAAPGVLRSFDFDQHGDFLIAINSRDIYRLNNVATIPPNGIAPTFVGQLAYPNSAGSNADITVIGADATPFRLNLVKEGFLGAKMSLENVPSPLGIGYIFLSTTTYLQAGSGPFFGLMPDALTLAIMTTSPTPGGILAFTATPPAPLTLPPLSLASFAGQTWDGVAVVFNPSGILSGKSNVVRITWQ